MMNILPLSERIRKRAHLEVARLQDELVELLYGIDDSLVLHGGTAIWRCFKGNRFSEDLDFYSNKPTTLEKDFPLEVSKRGLILKKFKKTSNLFFAKVSDTRAEVRVEINFSSGKKGVATAFERVDGSFMEVFCLPVKELFFEKLLACEKRRLARDFYDVLHLSNYVSGDEEAGRRVKKFLKNVNPPVDESVLKTIVYAGAVPSFKQIMEALERRFS